MLTKMECDRILERYELKGYTEAGKLAVQLLRADNGFRGMLVAIDSELSAIAHGRKPFDKSVLVDLYSKLRSSTNSV